MWLFNTDKKPKKNNLDNIERKETHRQNNKHSIKPKSSKDRKERCRYETVQEVSWYHEHCVVQTHLSVLIIRIIHFIRF